MTAQCQAVRFHRKRREAGADSKSGGFNAVKTSRHRHRKFFISQEKSLSSLRVLNSAKSVWRHRIKDGGLEIGLPEMRENIPAKRMETGGNPDSGEPA